MTQWWQSGTIYQVYPRSWQDSDGDGIGDLKGIEARLDHLVALGVDAVWISPIFPSPMADFGYDVADYTGIDPRFGTLADFDDLLAAAHARGLKLLLDFVPNHSSSEHPWFQASRSARTDPKRDWYIWRDPAPGGGPPNNWQSFFGGSAWEYDDASGQYYLHLFLKEQPDLNWRNPAVQAAMLDAMRFWFDRGVDGFRIDVLWLAIKHAEYPDNPPNPAWREGMQDIDRLLPLHSADQPEITQVVTAMRALADGYDARVLIGEIYLPFDRLVTYYGPDGGGVHLPFNFELLQTPWTAQAIAKLITDYEAALPPGAWPNWVLGNHDKPRMAARVGQAQARVAAVLLLTLRGTPTLYAGDEIGLTGDPIPTDQIRDPQALREPGIAFNRDEVRMPMPWNDGPQAGFTTGEPWLPLNSDWSTRNVAAQAADPASLLALHRDLLHLRRKHAALAIGDITLIAVEGDVLAYERTSGDERLVIALNLGALDQHVTLPEGELLLSTLNEPVPESDRGGEITLAPDEAIILRISR
ncbi:MAG TPA: alpha-amylase family glycosyl hydrolase [Sphingomonas sp.]|jgi:glycosidase